MLKMKAVLEKIIIYLTLSDKNEKDLLENGIYYWYPLY